MGIDTQGYVPDSEKEGAVKEQNREEEKRREVIEWAAAMGKDEAWVNEIFTFHSNGTLTADGGLGLNLFDLPVEHLPKGITHASSVDLSYTNISSVEELQGIQIIGPIKLSHTKITSLKGLPESVSGFLDLSYTEITSLEGCPQKIDGNLRIDHTPIKSLDGLPLPENVENIFFDSSQELLIQEAVKRGYLVREYENK